MNILHIVPSYYPAFEFGGPTQSVHLLNVALMKKSIAVKVLTTNIGLENIEHIETGKWLDINGVQVKYFPFYVKQIGKSFTFSPGLFFALFHEVKKCDLVHITGVWNFPIISASLVSNINSKPYIISPRGMLYKETFMMGNKYMKRIYYDFLIKYYLNRASAIHFTSEDERSSTLSYLKLNRPALVIPNGIDLTSYKTLPNKSLFKNKYNILSNQKYILFLGRISKKKGLDILITAFEDLVKVDSDLLLVIAGPDTEDYKKELDYLLEIRGLTNKVLFTGLLSGGDKHSAIVDSEMLVLPSYSENFGMVVIEAMACGTPVVISNKVGIAKEVQEYNAGIVTEISASDLAGNIRKLLSNPGLRDTLARNGKRMVTENYDIDKVVQKMINGYNSIIKTVQVGTN